MAGLQRKLSEKRDIIKSLSLSIGQLAETLVVTVLSCNSRNVNVAQRDGIPQYCTVGENVSTIFCLS